MAHVDEPPAVVMVVGVNGAGKTTTIGKLAQRYKAEGRTVLLALPTRSVRPQSNSSRSGASAPTPKSSARSRAPIPVQCFSTRCRPPSRAESTT